MSKNLRGLSERKGLEDNLFGEVVRISSEAPDHRDILLKELSNKYLIGKSTVLGTSSFYDFLKSEHIGKKVFICDGTACLTSGKQEKLRNGLLESFMEEEIGTVTCLGHCHTNHAFMYNHATYSLADLGSLDKIIKSGSQIITAFNTGTNADKPALLGEINDLKEYYQIMGEFAGNISGALKEIELSALRGRGGAGFPFHVKLKTTGNTVSDQKYVVCNADEGDPGAFSDKWLLEERPHSVLFGMMMTGLITGAQTGAIYIRGEYPESVRAVKGAIEQLEREKLTGNKIFLGDFNFKFHVVEGAGAYICGEETSLLNSLEGLRPEVRTRPPFPAQFGLFGKPTVLSNVETFANIRYILNEGGLAYSAMGTEKSAGTKLVSLDGAFLRPGLYEVRMGTPLRVVLKEMGGGTRNPVKAFQIGGPLGGIIPAAMVNDLSLDFESFSEAGFLLGHAGVVSIPADFPIVKYLLHLFEFTSRESCGKCFPCRIGADRGFELLKRAVDKGEKIDKELFSDLMETLQLGSLCALGGGLPLPVKNALQYFSSELEEYFTSKNH
jgi:NADH-quinone oxidoreductase subunit F